MMKDKDIRYSGPKDFSFRDACILFRWWIDTTPYVLLKK